MNAEKKGNKQSSNQIGSKCIFVLSISRGPQIYWRETFDKTALQLITTQLNSIPQIRVKHITGDKDTRRRQWGRETNGYLCLQGSCFQ